MPVVGHVHVESEQYSGGVRIILAFGALSRSCVILRKKKTIIGTNLLDDGERLFINDKMVPEMYELPLV